MNTMKIRKLLLLSLSLTSTTLLSGCGWGINEPLFPSHPHIKVSKPVIENNDNNNAPQSVEDIINKESGSVNNSISNTVSSGNNVINGVKDNINNSISSTIDSSDNAISNARDTINRNVEAERAQLAGGANTVINGVNNGIQSASNSINGVVDAATATPGFIYQNGVKKKLITKEISISNPMVYPAKGGFLDCPHRGFVPFYKTGWTYDYVLHIRLSSLDITGYKAFGDSISVPVTTSDSWSSFIDFGNCSGYGIVAHWRKDTLNTGRTFIDYTFYANNAGVDTEISSTHTIEINPDTGHQISEQDISLNASSIQPQLQLSGDVTVTPGQNYKQIYYQNKNHPHYLGASGGFGVGFPGESGYSGTGAGRYIDESVRPETGGVGPIVK